MSWQIPNSSSKIRVGNVYICNTVDIVIIPNVVNYY